MIDFLKVILRGFSQVMLQNNSTTGLLFLIGVFYNSWVMGLGALIGVSASTIAAFILNYKRQDVDNGLYGFNGVLVGISLLFFFKISILLVLLIIFGSVISSLIMNYMRRKKLAPYTFPFVVSSWLLIALIKYLNLVPSQSQELAEAVSLDIASSLSYGFGQVMFQASMVSGIIFFIAILINSRKYAVYALLGSALCVLVTFGLSFPLNLVNTGIFGFNGVLCGIAFADEHKHSLSYATISIILSVFIVYGMIALNLPALTAPFVLATWATLGLRKIGYNAQHHFVRK